MTNSVPSGWHRADIIAAVHKKGSNLRRLSLENGFAEATVRASLHQRHPKANAIIAEFIGVPQSELWPEWYAPAGTSTRVKDDSTRRRPASSQKRRSAQT